MKPTTLSPTSSQGNGQLNGQLKSPNLDGHPNGCGIQKPVQKVGDEWCEVPVVAINGDTDVDDRALKKSVTSPSLNGANGSEPEFIKAHPTPNMQDVDDVGSITAPTTATASPATASISAALAPSPSPSTTLSSPITPTPSSMSFTFHKYQPPPAQLDLTTSDQSNLEIPSSMQSPESSSNSNTPRISSAVLLSSSFEGCKGDENQKEDRETKITIPDSSSSSSLGIDSTPSTNIPNPYPISSSTPTTSRPSSTSIDPNLFSNRPAPPSPALSRRVSGVPSIASTSSTHSRSRSRSSRPPSSVISRTNSTRMSGVGSDAKRQSLGTQLSQFLAAGTDAGDRNGGSATPTPAAVTTTALTGSGSPMGSPQKLNFRLNPQTPSQQTSTSASASTSPTIVPTPSDPIPTPTPTTARPNTTQLPTATPPVYIKIRDFGFPSTDERHLGLGTDTPKANRIHRLNRKLGRPDRARAAAAALDPSSGRPELGSRRTDSIGSMGSVDSSDVDVEEEEDEDEGWGIGISGWGKEGKGGGGGKGWEGFRMGMGRFSWTIRSNNSNSQNDAIDNDNHSKGTSLSSSKTTFPSRKDLDMNFMDASSSSSSDDEQRGREEGFTEEFPDDFDDELDETGLQNRGDENDEYADAEDGGGGEPEEPLYPGLYRALYAFEPEGTAEMKLDEGQMVRVVGRGGGIGWAVVVDDRSGGGGIGDVTPLKHALVPEGYLEAVRLDWEEDEEEGLESAGG